MSEYKTTVGIEVHAELKTKSKMFCGCPNDPHASEPNSNVCPICLAHPGTLPSVNKAAVEAVLQVGAAIGAELADYSEFDRKNYFYPDIPKAYQISQYAYPLVSGGELAGVAITRIHLEEDTARSQHEADASLVDFNRAGVPLMELVTEPVIHDAKAAGDFARELQLLLRTLGVSDANMEKGEMRVEANISVSNSDTLGTKVEVKNLNSFKSMEAAIAYETKRQIAALEAGETLVQETRGWDEEKLVTFTQRVKESADDYRYFPDPDIPKYKRSELAEFSNSRLAEKTPMLATEFKVLAADLGLKEVAVDELTFNLPARNFFLLTLEAAPDKQATAVLAANYILTDISSAVGEDMLATYTSDHAAVFSELLSMLADSVITSRVAKDLLPEILQTLESPKNIAESRGLLQSNSAEELEGMVDEIVAGNQEAVAEFQAGKEQALKFLVGQGMKLSRGSANPQLLETLLKEKLSK